MAAAVADIDSPALQFVAPDRPSCLLRCATGMANPSISPILQSAVQTRRFIVDGNRRAARRYFSRPDKACGGVSGPRP